MDNYRYTLNQLAELIRQLLPGYRLTPKDGRTAFELGEFCWQGRCRCRRERKKFTPWLNGIPIAPRTARECMQIYHSGRKPEEMETITDAILFARQGKRKFNEQDRIEKAKYLKVNPSEPVICADALDWLRMQPDRSVPYFVTDPPFFRGTVYDGFTETTDPSEYWQWFSPFWEEMKRVVKDNGRIALFADIGFLPYFRQWYGKNIQVCADCRHSGILRQWSPVFVWSRGLRLIPTDWLPAAHGSRLNERKLAHPCAKPIESALAVVEQYTDKGCLVVDPFCGSGAIPLACKRLGRPYIAIDRSERYCELTRQTLAA